MSNGPSITDLHVLNELNDCHVRIRHAVDVAYSHPFRRKYTQPLLLIDDSKEQPRLHRVVHGRFRSIHSKVVTVQRGCTCEVPQKPALPHEDIFVESEERADLWHILLGPISLEGCDG